MNDIIRKPSPPAKHLPRPVAPAQAPQPVVGRPPARPMAEKIIEQSKGPSWLKRVLIAAAGLFALVLIAAGVGYFMYQQALQPKSKEMQNIAIEVPQGATTEQVANQLADAGLVQSGLATQIYMRLSGDSSIKAGHYVLSPDQSVPTIVEWLKAGRTDTLRVTILPGRTLNDLKKDLAKYGFDAAEIDAALTKNYDHALLKDKPAGVNLEGYVFPETYFMDTTATAEDIVVRSFDEFESKLQADGMIDKLAARGLNIHQAVTLASMVSAEVGNPEDRRKVAQVFEKRLQEGMPLGSDVTYIYAAEQTGQPATPDLDSPYNTRKVTGLPPGAIQNFNFETLEAVANPANTSYLFFVAGDDGITRYAYTVEEHEANVVKFCQKACFSN